MTIIKGQKLSEETKYKMSLVRTGKKFSSQTKVNISNSLKGRKLSEEHIRKIRKNMRGSKNPNWNGGKRKNSQGYILILDESYQNKNKRYLYEHRVIVENKLGRKLRKNEIVHHLNGIRHDNRPGNLCVVAKPQHENRTYVKLLQKRIIKLEQIINNNSAG